VIISGGVNNDLHQSFGITRYVIASDIDPKSMTQ